MSALQQFLDQYAAEWGENSQSIAAAAELVALEMTLLDQKNTINKLRELVWNLAEDSERMMQLIGGSMDERANVEAARAFLAKPTATHEAA